VLSLGRNNCSRLPTRPRVGFVVLVLIGVLSAATGPASAAGREAPASAAVRARQARTYVYKGLLSTRIHYFNICGTDLGVREARFGIQVVAGPPLRPTAESPGLARAVGTETNVIHLVVGSKNSSSNGSPGFITLASALRFGGTSPPVILQYWKLRLHGEHLTGRLVDDHRAQAAAINELTALTEVVPCQPQDGAFPNPFAISVGARLEGTITTKGVHLLVKGNVVEGTRPFSALISAKRV
jgi:hypothetical protein